MIEDPYQIELVKQLVDAQADLQIALGLYRLYFLKNEGHKGHDNVEHYMQTCLAQLHSLLDDLGHTMANAATVPPPATRSDGAV